jgi:hypothetical protein
MLGGLKGYQVVIAALVVIVLVLAFTLKSEGANMSDPAAYNVAMGAGSGGIGVQQQEFDGANLGSGSNAKRQRLASVPGLYKKGDIITDDQNNADYLRWCGVDNLNAYEAKGYAAMENPRGWLLSSAYDGEPALKLAEGYIPGDVAGQALYGL